MKKLILLSAMALLILATISCNKEEQSNNLPFDFKFTLLDTLGNEKTVFNRGENIIFSFEITNKTSQDVHIGNFLPNDRFFRVFQLNSPDGKLDYGAPTCCPVEIGYFIIKSNSVLKIQESLYRTSLKLGYPILDCEYITGMDLPKGDFITEFSQSFEISEIGKEHYFTEEKHFKINFTIK